VKLLHKDFWDVAGEERALEEIAGKQDGKGLLKTLTCDRTSKGPCFGCNCC